MPTIRPTGALRVARSIQRRTTNGNPTQSVRPFASSPRRAADSHHHESRYDPPTGWLFGVKPGEKYQPEGWERPFFWGFCGSLIVFACVLPFQPDTSIETWALEEARRRLEAEGILEDPFPDHAEKED